MAILFLYRGVEGPHWRDSIAFHPFDAIYVRQIIPRMVSFPFGVFPLRVQGRVFTSSSQFAVVTGRGTPDPHGARGKEDSVALCFGQAVRSGIKNNGLYCTRCVRR